MIKTEMRAAKKMRVSPKNQGEYLECRLEFHEGSPIAFRLEPKGAMTLMVALQAYQKRWHWPIPMIRIFRAKK
jgi:hypothetical protein